VDPAEIFRVEAGDVLLSVQLTLANEGGDGTPAAEPLPATPPGIVSLDRAVGEGALSRSRHPSIPATPGRLVDAVFVDPGTGAGTVRTLRRDLATEVSWSHGRGSSPSIVGLRVQPCAELRASGGDEAADALLRAVAEVIPFMVRGRDRVYRTGPDELALLMPATADEGKEAALRRLISGVPKVIADRKLGEVRLIARRIPPGELHATG
jgi:GGDEF domain-containing protein